MIGSGLESKSGFFHHVYRGKRKVEKTIKLMNIPNNMTRYYII